MSGTDSSTYLCNGRLRGNDFNSGGLTEELGRNKVPLKVTCLPSEREATVDFDML